MTVRTILLCCLLFAGGLLRANQLGDIRPEEEDEKSWLFSGMSLWETGTPASWSLFSEKYGYDNEWGIGGQEEEVITPYLDHPPLFSLCMGAWAIVTGQNQGGTFDWFLLRLPMLALSMVTLWLTFLFVDRVFRNRTFAILTLLAFVFFPSSIVGGRFIAAENVMAPLLLMSLLSLHRLLRAPSDKRARWHKLFLIIVCCLAVLIKLSAILIPASLIFLCFLHGRRRMGWILVCCTALSLALVALYGMLIDWDTFLFVQGLHSFREQSLMHFWTFFTQLDVGNMSFDDASLIAGMIALLLLVSNEKQPTLARSFLIAPLLVCTFLFSFVAPIEAYGWYKFVVYPFIAIGLGSLFSLATAPRLEAFILLYPLTLVMLENAGMSPQQKLPMIVLYVPLVLLALLTRNDLRQSLLRFTGWGLIAVLVIAETAWIVSL